MKKEEVIQILKKELTCTEMIERGIESSVCHEHRGSCDNCAYFVNPDKLNEAMREAVRLLSKEEDK